MKKVKYTAYYQPSGHPEYTKSGFNSRKEAEEYIISYNCKDCKPEGMASSCSAEWLIMTDKDYEGAENHMDLLLAGGYKRIK